MHLQKPGQDADKEYDMTEDFKRSKRRAEAAPMSYLGQEARQGDGRGSMKTGCVTWSAVPRCSMPRLGTAEFRAYSNNSKAAAQTRQDNKVAAQKQQARAMFNELQREMAAWDEDCDGTGI
jgi:hypothetical protein